MKMILPREHKRCRFFPPSFISKRKRISFLPPDRIVVVSEMTGPIAVLFPLSIRFVSSDFKLKLCSNMERASIWQLCCFHWRSGRTGLWLQNGGQQERGTEWKGWVWGTVWLFSVKGEAEQGEWAGWEVCCCATAYYHMDDACVHPWGSRVSG